LELLTAVTMEIKGPLIWSLMADNLFHDTRTHTHTHTHKIALCTTLHYPLKPAGLEPETANVIPPTFQKFTIILLK